jgi:hypothetical protein
MSWQDIAVGEIAAQAPITQELMRKLYDRDLALRESCGGGRWNAIMLSHGGTARWLRRYYVGRSCDWLYVRCESGKTGGAGTDPRMRLYAVMGATTSYGAFTSLLGIGYPTRVLFAPIPILAAMRSQYVELWAEAADAPASGLSMYLRNDPTASTEGYGICPR